MVIDCPPLDGFAETSLVTTLASSVILVVDRRRQDLLDIERAIAMLQSRGAAVISSVTLRQISTILPPERAWGLWASRQIVWSAATRPS